jgi:hypothetical protein
MDFTFFAIVLLLAQGATADVGRTNKLANDQVIMRGTIGAIVDNSSRFGMEQKVAMEMAIKDVYDETGQSCGLLMKASQREPYQTAVAGMYTHIYMSAFFSQPSRTLIKVLHPLFSSIYICRLFFLNQVVR